MGPQQSTVEQDAARPLPLVFDTSILTGLRPDDLSPEFRLLQRLSESGKVELLVPALAAREWLSQRVEPATKALDELVAALADVRRSPSLADDPHLKPLLERKLEGSLVEDIRRGSFAWHERQFAKLRLRSVEILHEDVRAVLDGYFMGTPPFSAKKARKDFPDAFVLEGVLRIFKADDRAIFVCNDDRLRNAAKDHGIAVAGSVADALKLKPISSLHSNLTFALWWEKECRSVIAMLRLAEADIQDLVEDNLLGAIVATPIRHRSIPEDNHEASVVSAGDISDIAVGWDMIESLGEGLLSVPVTFQADVELSFRIYRSEAFSTTWVHVSFGDPGEHYFEAYGSRRARYKARMVFGFTESVMSENAALDDAEITVEDLEFDDFVDLGT